jgi:hypothetical protein
MSTFANGQLQDRSHVEHICVSPELSAGGDILAWDRTDESGMKLSDHPTLACDLRLRADGPHGRVNSRASGV